MLIDLKAVLSEAVNPLEFSYTLDLSELDFFGERPVAPSSVVSGRITNRAGVLYLDASVACRLVTICASCGDPVDRPFVPELHACILPEGTDTEMDDALFYSGDEFDMDAAAADAVVLNMDMRILCRDDCRGLCPRCGKNLNDGPCGCSAPVDPRLEKLRALLQRDE